MAAFSIGDIVQTNGKEWDHSNAVVEGIKVHTDGTLIYLLRYIIKVEDMPPSTGL